MPAPAPEAPPLQQPLPALRQDLTLRQGASDNDGAANWLIYDPVRHRYFQIDAAAFELLAIWRPVAMALGWINSRLILGLAFFGLLLPVGWAMRTFGKLTYVAKPDAGIDSYRTIREKEYAPEDFEHPY